MYLKVTVPQLNQNSQEDMGEPLVNFAEEIIAAKERNPDLRFFFHAGETDWQGSSTDVNVIDALLVCREQKQLHNLRVGQEQQLILKFSNV